MRMPLPRAALVAFLLTGFICFAQAARASELMRPNVKEIAGDLKKILDDLESKDLRFGAIAPLPGTNPAPEIKRILAEELNKLDVKVKLKSSYGVVGLFKEVNEDKVELEVKVVDPKNKAVRVLNYLFERDDIVPPEKKYLIKGSQVFEEGGNYGIEVLVGGKGRKPIMNKDQQPFVELQKGEVYEIRLLNESAHESAALVQIDGINIFAFSQDPEIDGKRREYRMVVDRGKPVEVKGWYRKDGVSDTFRVAAYSDAEPGKLLGSPGAIGVITVTFKAAWLTTQKPPADEGRSKLMTEKGPPVSSPYERVLRTVGRDRATICIRYNREE